MINGPGEFSRRSLVVVAHDAALRFSKRRISDTSRIKRQVRRDSWRPTVLCWRKRRNRPLYVSRPASTTTFLSFTQFHSHFATYLNNRALHDRRDQRLSEPTIQKTRVVLHHHWTVAHRNARHQPWRRPYRPWRYTGAHDSSPSNVPASPTQPVTSQSLPAHVTAPGAQQRLQTLMFWLTERIGAHRSAERHTPALQPQLQIQQLHLPRFNSAAAKPGRRVLPHLGKRKQLQLRCDQSTRLAWRRDLLSPALLASSARHQHPTRSIDGQPRSQASRPMRYQLREPEELVWRQARQLPESMDDKAQQECSEKVNNVRAMRAALPQESEHAAALSKRTAALQVPKFDSGLLDRLTDDVIRRVEQRIRIDRQRRGL